MSDLETRLTGALSADAPPARDAVFRVEVLMRLERKRFRRHVRRIVFTTTLLAVLAAVSAPAIDDWIAADDSRIWLVVFGAAAATCALSAMLLVPGFRVAVSAVGRLLYP
jgi:hypothetical protein